MIITYLSYMLTVSLGCIFELFILNKFLGYELRVKKVPLIITSVALAALMFLVVWKRPVEDSDLLMALFYMAIPYFVLKPHKKIQFILLGFVMDGFFDVLSQITIRLFKTEITTLLLNITVSAWFLICLLISLLLYYKKRFVIPKFFLEKIPALFYIMFCLVLLITTLMLDSDIEVFASAENYFAGGFVILAFIGLSYIVFKYINISVKQRESEIQLEMQAKHYQDLAEKNRDIRRFRHDIKNNLLALDILLSDGKYDEAKNYIDSMNESVKETENRFSTGSYLADAILSHKADEIKNDKIDIEFSGTVPSERISNNDLCTILTNSIDNAARACKEIAPCKINVTSDETEKGCTLTVSNPVLKKVEIKNNSIKTSKKDAQNHGFGIENIKKVAEKYHGFVRLSCTDSEFTIKIGLLY
jgi:two-component system sensor histidine kinase AgrC